MIDKIFRYADIPETQQVTVGDPMNSLLNMAMYLCAPNAHISLNSEFLALRPERKLGGMLRGRGGMPSRPVLRAPT